jgi:putative SOS response-associated peptidase YedK
MHDEVTMCGRFYVEIGEKELLDIIKNADSCAYHGMSFKTEGEIFPGDVVLARTCTGEFLPMKWGFTPSDGRLIINARSETADERPMFRSAMANSRCLIPASGYFEWKKNGKLRTKYAFHAPSGMIYFAGCFRQEKDLPIPSFVILTRDAVNGLEKIHDRMPVIIPKNRMIDWLNGGEGIADSVIELVFQPVEESESKQLQLE